MASVSLTRVIEKMKLENLTPEIDVKHVKITQPDINRPALQLAGYFEHFDATTLQIILIWRGCQMRPAGRRMRS